jgi:hypothetical protein
VDGGAGAVPASVAGRDPGGASAGGGEQSKSGGAASTTEGGAGAREPLDERGGAGGLGEPEVGGGGAATAGGCVKPETRSVVVDQDTWIQSDKASATHEKDSQLLVAAGADERRALLSFLLPAFPADTELVEATLVLELQANADTTRAPRTLTLHELEQPFVASRTNWKGWSSGSSGEWRLAGGDFGAELANAKLSAGTSGGKVAFNVTGRARSLLASGAASWSLIVIEADLPPRPPAELAFGALEGNVVALPALTLELCLP